jgi:transcriptional regulator with XRE-family HTH domain
VPALNPTVRHRRLGIELRRLREEAGLTIEDVAGRLECSISKISRIETAQVRAIPRDIRDLLDVYRVEGDLREALLQIARDARRRGWWDAYGDLPMAPMASLEMAANSVRSYSQALVPGLLQTAEYARAILRELRVNLMESDIDRQVELRLARQGFLTGDDPLTLWAVLDEAVVRRPVGGRQVMKRQLHHLAEVGALRNVTLQVHPFRSGAHAGLDGQFTIIGFPEAAESDLVSVENAISDLYIEDAASVDRYIDIFERVRATALSPAASRAFLAEAATRR